MRKVERRDFIGLAAGALTLGLDKPAPPIPIIDTHIHLFDTNRPQGVPWPPQEDKLLYKTALPARFEQLAAPLNVVGAIEIEASPLLEDNQWVLDIAAKSPIIVGTIGDLEPGAPEFSEHLDRFQKNKLFLGIRYGNLWGRDLRARIEEPQFLHGLQRISEANMVLDTANPDPALIRTVVRLSDKLPNLRIVVDHLPRLELPQGPASRAAYQSDLRELGRRKQIFVKLSEPLVGSHPGIPATPAAYRPILDHLFETFGEDRVLYASDWPNSDSWGTYREVLQAVQQYFATKSRAAQEKFFWRNSVTAYHWVHRDDKQPRA